ncbi:MAG: 7-cyano-7-deazaguanine synthase [Xanthobacteraceae bacterium]
MIASECALVLFSGGQDSTVCLAWALARFARVETVGFFYGQRHAVELEQRPRIREEVKALDPGVGATAWRRSCSEARCASQRSLRLR